MAFTRKFLSALGIEADKIEQIIDAHTEVTDALKAERDGYKADAEKLPGVQQKLDELKAAAEKDGKDPYKVKYEAIKEEFETYKNEQTAKETKAAKTAAYKALLKAAGIADKRIEAVLKVSDIEGIKLDKDGKVEGEDEVLKGIREEWADFIPTKSQQGAKTETPPANAGGGKMSKADILAIKDTAERQKAIAENHELFGF